MLLQQSLHEHILSLHRSVCLFELVDLRSHELHLLYLVVHCILVNSLLRARAMLAWGCSAKSTHLDAHAHLTSQPVYRIHCAPGPTALQVDFHHAEGLDPCLGVSCTWFATSFSPQPSHAREQFD